MFPRRSAGKGHARSWGGLLPLIRGAILSLGFLGLPAAGVADEPSRSTHELLGLLPADASVVLTVDDLRGQTRDLLASRLGEEFQKLGAVKAWFKSEKYEELDRARDQIEEVLQVSLTEIRDKVLGDGVVFALRLPADEPFDPAKARGILLLKAADPALLGRMVDLVNTIQKQNGEVASIGQRRHGVTTYQVRAFPAGAGRLPDAYVSFPDGTFAISNDEGLIHHLIDRKATAGKVVKSGEAGMTPTSMAESPRFRALERRLPDRDVVRLFVDARQLSRLLATVPQPAKEEDRRNIAIVQRLLAGIESAGAGLLVTDERLVLHAAEVFDPREFKKIFGATAGADRTAIIPDHLPVSTLAVGSISLDIAAAYQLLVQWVPEADQPRLASMETILRGIFLGQDLRTRVLPALGPGVLALVDAPSDQDLQTDPGGASPGKWPFPTVLSLELRGDRDQASSLTGTAGATGFSIAAAADNALRTLLAALCLDEKHAQGRARIVSRDVAGVAVTSMEPSIPFAFAVDAKGHRLVLGTSADAVGRSIECGSDPDSGARFRRLRSIAFPEARTFFCLDLATSAQVGEKHRERLTKIVATRDHRPAEEVARDLDRVIELARLFDAFFVTSRIDAQTSTVHQTLGLLGRNDGAKAEPTATP
jgi:hypothetical protein